MLTRDGSAKDGEIITVTVADIARGGAGVAREDSGRVIFIPYTAPGDRVSVRITTKHKHYAQGELLEVLAPSPSRITPRCPLFGRCGGCEWQHLSYEQQWQVKIRGVRHALTRTGIKAPEIYDEFPAENPWGYRNRIQLRGFKEKIGFFEQNSHELVPASRCDIARPEINAAWGDIREEGSKLSRPYKVEIEVSKNGEVRTAWNSKHGALGFRQIFDEQNEKLREWIAEALTPSARLLDLFGGTGNLSIKLAERMTSVDCIDTGQQETAETLPANFHLHRAPVLTWLIRAVDALKGARENKGCAAILDPPRAGLGKDIREIAPALDKLGTRELIAVGCDPDSWARDICSFTKYGWTLVKCASLDFFPQTPHVESVAFLRNDN